MKPTVESMRKACPEVEEGFIQEHLSRLEDRYFSSFGEDDLFRHLRGLSSLTPERPARIFMRTRRDGQVDCTVLAFDYPSELSLITGVLAGMGFNIQSGDVFTYASSSEENSPGNQSVQSSDLLKRRRIIDHFTGTRDSALPFQAWVSECENRMEEVLRLLEQADRASVERAKNQVREMIARQLERTQRSARPVLYPVQMEIDNETTPRTRLKIISEDTPLFLYALSNALSLHDVLIEHVRIRTIRGRVEDQIDLVDSRGRPVTDSKDLDRVRLSVLITKQFTYFLGGAPDPHAALSRFEYLVDDILRLPAQGKWLDLLTNPHTLKDLARLLGASDFLWEDFIRTQYETLIPMLGPEVGERPVGERVESLGTRMEAAIAGDIPWEEKLERLNRFKDNEIYLIDLDHILNPATDFRDLARNLTLLAESVLGAASEIVYAQLLEKHGKPRTAAGLEAGHAIMGMGKLGGAALGYASDIELLFVYSDGGQTDGERVIKNDEFFSYWARETAKAIQAKREGIFQVDLRLRPHGNAGPLACSLDHFIRYYGQGGQAHSFERLALVRLRAIAGDPGLGAQLERLRDDILYASKSIDLGELRALREKQFQEKAKGVGLNAKFSPGGLVDLEYGVQVLQVMGGQEVPQLRTPRVHEALGVLGEAGVLSPEETVRLTGAYDFLRKLINSMRMLRGNARDLFLPPVESIEYAHLARRMGYGGGGPLDPAHQLHIDFETHTATVRRFAESHFGRDSLPGPAAGTVADLVLSDQLPIELQERILSGAGFMYPERAMVNLQGMAGQGPRRETFAKLALLAWDILKRMPDPDMALNNWERYSHSFGSPEFHFNMLLSQPMRLEILLTIFSGSQFMADTLVRNPGFLDWVIIPEVLHNIRRREDIEKELKKIAQGSDNHEDWRNRLRRLRRREILRIGTRDMYLGVSTRDVMLELSALAEACVRVTLERVLEAGRPGRAPGRQFCIMAMGKMGGNELNYSSDIDLIGIMDDSGPLPKDFFARAMEKVRSDLSAHTAEGYAYRVDLRLRPFGRAGELVPTATALMDYYRHNASLWEIQAALKMRPVAGNLKLGDTFLERLKPLLRERRERTDIVNSIDRMRRASLQSSSAGLGSTLDVKSGTGGLRDVEFLVQGLQLIHGPEIPGILGGNTLTALDNLQESGVLPDGVATQLKEDYIFLRRTEHYLQILEDRQIHALPRDPAALRVLARRMMGGHVEAEKFMEVLDHTLERIHDAYVTYLHGSAGLHGSEGLHGSAG